MLFRINREKEFTDIYSLVSIIKHDKWLDNKPPTIVICSPEFSGIVGQILIHELSFLNKNVPLDFKLLEMPYPNGEDFSEEDYIEDIQKLIPKLANLDKIIFIDSGVLRGRNFTVLKNTIQSEIDQEKVKYACIYLQDDSIFEPDYYVEKFNFKQQGGLTFWWENENSPYWGW
jgi:hypothetical protein